VLFSCGNKGVSSLESTAISGQKRGNLFLRVWAIAAVLTVIVFSSSAAQNETAQAIFQAERLYQKGQYDKATSLLENLLENSNLEQVDLLKAGEILAFAYASQQKFDLAIVRFQFLLTIDPQYQPDPQRTPALIMKIYNHVKKENPPGILWVDSRPSAECYVDGKLMGYTPTLTPGLTIGSKHEIALIAEGYATIRDTLTAIPDIKKLHAPMYELRPLIQVPRNDMFASASLYIGVCFGIATLMSYNDAYQSYDNYKGASTAVAARKFRGDTEKKSRRTYCLGGTCAAVLLFSGYRFWRNDRSAQEYQVGTDIGEYLAFDPQRRMILYRMSF